MIPLDAISFVTPWLLAALLVLIPLIFLLRLIPPAPKRLKFPGLKLLRDLVHKEETPHRSPWWIILLRMALAALLIFAIAEPLLNAAEDMEGDGPVVLAIDNDWAAARDWPVRLEQLEALINRAGRAKRPIYLLTSTSPLADDKLALDGPLSPAEARQKARALEPWPWPSERDQMLDVLKAIDFERGGHAFWLTNSVRDDSTQDIITHLQRIGAATVITGEEAVLPHLLLPPVPGRPGLQAEIKRGHSTAVETIRVQALTPNGRVLGRALVPFEPDQASAIASFDDLPPELRGEVAVLRIEGQNTAAATVLLDDRFKDRPVGLAAGTSQKDNQPLLSELYYLEQALDPYTEVRRGTLEDLLETPLAVMVLADIGTLSGDQAKALNDWVGKGGVLVRFAGPRLSNATVRDDLIPVTLRRGERLLGGALSWDDPQTIGSFNSDGPFAELTPTDEVQILRQVLAEPEPELQSKTWAALEDGTPLVTGAPRGEGWVVLIHTTAGPGWSNLHLSGQYVEMMRRLTTLALGVEGTDSDRSLPPVEVLNGYGDRIAPGPAAAPVKAGEIALMTPDPRHPPGFYGNDTSRRALNLTNTVTEVTPITDLPRSVTLASYKRGQETELKPWLLLAALALLILDFMVAFAYKGILPMAAPSSGRLSRTGTTTALLLVAATGLSILAISATTLEDSPFSANSHLMTQSQPLQEAT
ncbi:MAG: hypothetical protein Alpg2KO_11180 [Alphaproteobacteria bacterium]